MKVRIIVFSGYNQRAVLALLRTMTKLNILYHIIASGKNDTIFQTTYRNSVFYVREDQSLNIHNFIYILSKLRNTYTEDEFVIAPSTESLNRLFLENREQLLQLGVILPLPERSVYYLISDKLNFHKLCKENKITVPGIYPDLKECPETFVAKPRYNYSSITKKFLSPQLIHSESEKEVFQSNYNLEDFYFERYITGESYYLLYYFDRLGKVYRFSQENLLQQADGKSILLARPAKIHLNPVSETFEKIFAALGFRGLVMVEIRKHDDQYFMIEANPRMWGPSQLCVDANMNFLHEFLYDWEVTCIKPDFSAPDYSARYCWLGGIKKDLAANKQLAVLSQSKIAMEEFKSFLAHDIYCRHDTIEIFEKE